MRSSFRHHEIVYGPFGSVIAVPLFVRRVALHERPKSLSAAYLHPSLSISDAENGDYERDDCLGQKGSTAPPRGGVGLDATPADRKKVLLRGQAHKTCYAVIVRPIARNRLSLRKEDVFPFRGIQEWRKNLLETFGNL